MTNISAHIEAVAQQIADIFTGSSRFVVMGSVASLT